MSKTVNEEPLRCIIRNVERLLKDAHILLENGSPGSALSMAILAFEEAGKGHRHELEIDKTKRTPSWHHFRQVIAAYVVMASLFQKYGLSEPKMSDRARELIEERWMSTKTLAEASQQPIPPEFRMEVAKCDIPGLTGLDADQLLIFSVELRWANKIMKAASQGVVEQQRQRGMYVDLEGDTVTSSPVSITKQEAYYWIRVAERVLRLLKHGEFREPYGELAATLEAMPKPLPPNEELMRMLGEMQSAAAEAMADVEESAG